MANPSLANNTATVNIYCRPNQADDFGQKYDADFNVSNNYMQSMSVSILSMYGEDVFFIKSNQNSKIYKCKFDQLILTGSGIIQNPTGGSDKNNVYTQVTPSNTATINHGLNKLPAVQLFEQSTGNFMLGNFRHIDSNNVYVSFDIPAFTWFATFN